jgi:hypothetical protein
MTPNATGKEPPDLGCEGRRVVNGARQKHMKKRHTPVAILRSDAPYDPRDREAVLSFWEAGIPHTGVAELRTLREHPKENGDGNQDERRQTKKDGKDGLVFRQR